MMVIWESIVRAYTVEATCGSWTRAAVLSGTSGFFGGSGFSFAPTLLVVSGAYAASFTLANGCTRGSSSLLTSSGVVGGGGGC